MKSTSLSFRRSRAISWHPQLTQNAALYSSIQDTLPAPTAEIKLMLVFLTTANEAISLRSIQSA